MSQDINQLGPKRAAIARALVHRGITIWEGIPQHIIEELERAGYKIKKKQEAPPVGVDNFPERY
jgi:hypothetical protein